MNSSEKATLVAAAQAAVDADNLCITNCQSQLTEDQDALDEANAIVPDDGPPGPPPPPGHTPPPGPQNISWSDGNVSFNRVLHEGDDFISYETAIFDGDSYQTVGHTLEGPDVDMRFTAISLTENATSGDTLYIRTDPKLGIDNLPFPAGEWASTIIP